MSRSASVASTIRLPGSPVSLVEQGIDSISLAPDTIVKTTIDLKKTEEKLGR